MVELLGHDVYLSWRFGEGDGTPGYLPPRSSLQGIPDVGSCPQDPFLLSPDSLPHTHPSEVPFLPLFSSRDPGASVAFCWLLRLGQEEWRMWQGTPMNVVGTPMEFSL